jgi:crossover junction endodeoxyribonuclease RusA
MPSNKPGERGDYYTIMFTLPYPPSANRYWRHGRGRTYKSDDARQYQEAAAWCAKLAGATLHDGAVGLELRFYRPERRGDLDNRIKVLLDALQGVLYLDDKQVKELHAYLSDMPANPRVEVTAWAIG